ncbi:MAG: 2'-5' RNA ligase family protein, partial [Terriglobales bacterium]
MSAFVPTTDITDPDFISKNAPPKARRAATPEFKMVEDSEPEFKMVEAPGGSKEQLAVDMARATTSGFPRAPLPKANSGLSLGASPVTPPDKASQLVSEQRERRASQYPVRPVSPGPGASQEDVNRLTPSPVRLAGGAQPSGSMQDAERDKNPVLAGIPGVTPETPEAGWERVTGGPRAMAAGFSKLDPLATQPNPTATEAIKGAAELTGGAFQTASPLLAVAGGEAALGARAAYPLVRDMIAIYGADKAVEMAAQKLNLSPDATALLKNMVMLAAPAVAARGIAATEPRGGTLEGPGITAGAGDILGGKAGGFYARTPDEYAAGAKVGPFEAAVRIPRNGGSAEASGQPALPQAPAPDASAQLITKYNNAVAKLQRVVTGQEPLIPPPPPPPTPPPAVTAQDVTRETQRIVKLPPDQQGPALQDAHAKLAQTLLAQGQTGKPVVLPNGQLAQIPDEKTASKVAIGLINDAVKDHDKAQEDAAKVAGKEAQKQAKEDAKPAPTNGNRQTRGERAAQLSEPVAKMVEAPAEPEFKMVEGNGNGQTEQAAKAEQVQPENQSAVGKAAGGNGAGNGAGGSEAVHAGRVDTTGKEEAKPESVISKHDSVTFPTKVQLEGRIVQPGETGTVQWADANSARVKLDSDGKVINSVALRHIEKKESPAESDRRHNLAERKRVAEMSPEELKKELLTSPVTGIPNRRAFDEAEHTPAKAVAMSDADGLKALNDRFGYAAGNQLLKAKAEALQEAGLEAYHEKGDEFLYRGNSSQELKTKLEKARSILRDRVITVTHDGEEQRFKGADFSHGTGTSLEEAERGLKAHKSEREAKGERARGELRGITQVGSEKGEVVQGGTEEVKKPKYKFGSTQANIPADSEAAKGLGIARSIISKDDLAGKGKDIGEGGEHVTVRYGIKNEDTEGIRKFLSEQSPFEATLGKTEKFPVSEHSEGAAPIIAPIDAPELHRINAEIEKHGDFSEPSFDKYKPHATVAYVKPDKADRYVGMDITKGKKFTVNEIAISKKDGSQEVVKLEGKKAAGVKLEAAKNEALGPAPGEVGRMKVSDLHVAPHKFQYKLGTDTSGTGTLLKETKVYNPQLAGTISVWRDPADGKWYVVNGHHRFELAKRSIQTRVNVMHIEAKDAAEARAIGARQNIGEGRGTPIDAAKFFRETSITPEDLEKHGISLGEATASNGLALSKLSDPLFTKVVQGELPQGQAIAIGEGTSDHAEQAAILKQIERKERGGGKVSADRIREFIRLAKGSEQRTETTADLFG